MTTDITEPMTTITRFTKEQLIAKAQEQIEFIRRTQVTGAGREHVDMCGELFEIALASLDTGSDSKQVDELTIWVKRLVHSLRNAKPDSKLPADAMDYLSRNRLISVEDVLR